MTKAKISEVICDKTTLRPVIANFEHAYLQPHKNDKVSCTIFNDKENVSKAVVTSDKLLYTGQINHEDEHNSFLLIRNKESRTCKLIAVDRVLLHPEQKSEKRKRTISEEELEKFSNIDLIKKFGSKKQKRKTEQYERLRVDVDTVKENLEEVADATTIQETDLLPVKPESTESMYKPVINREATKVVDVYPVEVVAPVQYLPHLEATATELLEKEADKLELTSEFVKRGILKLQKSQESDDKYFKAELFVYIECLVNFLKLPARGVSVKKYVPCEQSSKISEYILDHYTILTPTGRTRPTTMRDKCICYVLVLAMIVSDYELNVEILSQDLKQGMKKIVEMCRVLCFSSTKNKTTMALKLPLPAAPSMFGRPNNRKRK